MKSIKKILIATLFFTVPTFVLANINLTITGNCIDTDRVQSNPEQLNSTSCAVEARINGGAATNETGAPICVAGSGQRPNSVIVCESDLTYRSENGKAYTINSNEIICHTENVQWITDGNDMMCKKK